jgi:hypothetical protein
MKVSLFHRLIPSFIRVPLAILFRKLGISTTIQTALCISSANRRRYAFKPTKTDHSDSTVLIVCAHYNHLNYLPSCIDSLIAQTHPNWHLVIADDLSPDPSTPSTLASLASKDPRITAIRLSENSGAYIARNTALEAAPSDWTHITFIDPDDEATPHFLEHSLDVLGNHEGSVRPVLERWNEDFTKMKSMYVGHCPTLHSRLAWERAGGFLPVRVSGDSELTSRLHHLSKDGTTHLFSAHKTAQRCRLLPGSASHQSLRERKIWLETRSAAHAKMSANELRADPLTAPWQHCNQ